MNLLDYPIQVTASFVAFFFGRFDRVLSKPSPLQGIFLIWPAFCH